MNCPFCPARLTRWQSFVARWFGCSMYCKPAGGGGVTPALRRAYEDYAKNYRDR